MHMSHIEIIRQPDRYVTRVLWKIYVAPRHKPGICHTSFTNEHVSHLDTRQDYDIPVSQTSICRTYTSDKYLSHLGISMVFVTPRHQTGICHT